MIFKTTDDGALTNIFKEYAKLNDVFESLDKTTTRKIIKAFNNTSSSIEELSKKFGGLDDSVVDYLNTTERGKASMTGLKSNIDSSSTSMSLATIKAKALSIALNALTGLAITAAIQGTVWVFDKLITTLDEQKEKLDEAKSSYQESNSELSDLNNELQTTSERIDELNTKDNLTFTEKDELSKLKQTNDELERKIFLLEKANQESEKEIANEAKNLYGDFTNNRDVGLVEQVAFYDDSSLLEDVNWESYKNDISWLIAQYKKQQDLLKTAQDNGWSNIEDKTRENISLLEGYMADASNDYTSLYETISSLSDTAITPELEVAKTDLNEILNVVAQLLGYQGELEETAFNDIWDSSDFGNTKKELIEISKRGELTPETLSSNEKYKKLIEETGNSAQDTAEHINALVGEMKNEASTSSNENPISFSLTDDQSTAIDDFQSKVSSLSTTLESLKSGDFSDSDLVDLIQEFPTLSGETDNLQGAIKQLISGELKTLLQTLGTSAPSELTDSITAIADQILETSNRIGDLNTSDAIESLTKISDGMTKLDEARAKIISNDDKIDFSDLTSLNETFGDLDGFENFASVISNTASTAEQVQQAFNDLTTEYINNSGAMDTLTFSTADFVVQALKEMGVANAEEYVYAQLGLTIDQYSQLKAIATQRGIDLTNITYEEIQALVNEKQVTDETANVLYTYALQKELANENVLSTSSDIQNLQALVAALGATTTAIDLYNNMKSGFAANPILPGAGSGIHEDARNKALATAKSNAIAEAQAALDSALNSTTSLSNTAPTIDYTGGAKTADAMEQNLKDAEDAASAAEDALKSAYDAYAKLMSRREAMGLYENDPIKYVEDLGTLVNDYVYDQETAWDAEKKIYQAREKYLDEWVSKASDVYADLLDMLDTYQTQLQNKITLSNDNASKSTYNKLFKYYVTETKKYAEERDYLQQELNDYLQNYGGKKGDDRWTELTQKIADANTKIDETKLALRDLVDEYRDKWLDAIEDVYSRQISALEKYTDRLQDLYDLTGDTKYLTEMGTNYQDTLNEYITKKNYAQSQMDKQLKSGLISTDPTDGEAYQGYLTLLDTLNGLDDSINSVKKSIKALADTSLENWMDSVTELGSEAISLIDDYKSQLKSYISEIESAGGIVGNSLYEALITSTSQEMDAYTSRLNSLKQQLQNGLDNGLIEKYDENWQKLVASINETAQAITDTQSEINEFNTALMQLDFSKFDTLLSRLSSISSELDNILSTIDQVNTKLVDESAALTSDGLATIALNLQQREVGTYNLSQLKEEIANLQEQYKAGTYDMSEEEYLER